MNPATNTIRFFLDCLFPIECLGCGREGFWLCNECLQSIPMKTDFPCVACGKPTIFGKTHQECLSKVAIDGALCATSYEDKLIQEVIHVYKYKYVTGLGPPLAWLIAKFLIQLRNHILPRSILEKGLSPYNLMMIKMAPQFLVGPYHKNTTGRKNTNAPQNANIIGIDGHQSLRPRPQSDAPLLVPIPLHPRRQRERGFNQAEIIAQELGKYFNWPTATKVLIRKRHTSAQMKLKNQSQRQENIKNAFECLGETPVLGNPGSLRELKDASVKNKSRTLQDLFYSHSSPPQATTSAGKVRDKLVILIDDVLTTGATTNEAARALKKAGAKKVWVVCLAKD